MRQNKDIWIYIGRSGLDQTDDFQKLWGSGLDRIQFHRIRTGLKLKNFTVSSSLKSSDKATTLVSIHPSSFDSAISLQINHQPIRCLFTNLSYIMNKISINLNAPGFMTQVQQFEHIWTCDS